MTYFVLAEGTCKYCSGPTVIRDLDHRKVCYNICEKWVVAEDLVWNMREIGISYGMRYTPWEN